MRIEINKKIPSWHQISFFSRSPLFKASIIIMFIIPIWARLANIDSQINNYTHYIIGLLDNRIPAIPNNLLRIFWASFSINIAYIIYTVFCPKIIIKYKNFQHWLDEDEEAISSYITEVNKQGHLVEKDIIKNFKDKYQKEINQSSYYKPLLRSLISFLYIFSSILMGYAILHQIIPVLNITNFVKLISPNF